MKTINKIYKVIIFMFATLFVGCEYNDTNNDPTRTSEKEVPTIAIMPVMQLQMHRNKLAILGRISGIITQQWKGDTNHQAEYEKYAIGEDEGSNSWIFGLYVGSMRDCVDIINRIDGPKELNTRGVAKIYLAVNLGMTTDIWGDIPFSESFRSSEIEFPKYDSQESIYKNIIRLLDEAEEDLKATDALPIQGSLVKLDKNQWIKVANALKSRYYLHLIKRDPNAAQKALDALTKGMSSNTDQVIFKFENTINGGNPIALFGTQRGGDMIINNQFKALMNGDPRKDIFMIKHPEKDDYLFYEDNNKDLFWAQNDTPGLLISYAEQKFIEAEALERTGADGTVAFKEGVKANMEFLKIASTDITTYLATLTLGGTLEDDIKTIIGEKYKALYGNSPIETWNDYRRTGYPVLTPNPNGKNDTNPSGSIPRRLLYPEIERNTNEDSYKAAISAQGGHLLDNYTWIWPK